MPKNEFNLLPQQRRLIAQLAENIKLCRLRRRLSSTLIAERAGISRPTLSALENGEPGVSIGVLISVLASLGLAQDIGKVAADDDLGRKLVDAGLETKKRAPKQKNKIKVADKNSK